MTTLKERRRIFQGLSFIWVDRFTPEHFHINYLLQNIEWEDCLAKLVFQLIGRIYLISDYYFLGADFGVVSMHHVGILCENLERSLDFYQNILGNHLYFVLDDYITVKIHNFVV